MTEIEKHVNELAEESDFWGTVSVSEKDRILLECSYGYRDRANLLENNPETSFGLASGTKTVTAVAIGRLIDQGLLTLDTPMRDLFGSSTSFIDPKATVRHLLDHSSGVFDYYDEESIIDFDNFRVEIPWSLLETPSDFWPLYQGQSMKFPAGERFSYSNGGYILLGIIIERITEMPFREYVGKQILEPAGMSRSGFFPFNDLPVNTALGYMEVDGKWKTNIFNLPIRGASDGGMYSTAGDIRRFWNALFDGRLLSDGLLKELTTTQKVMNENCDYGFGLYLPGPVKGKVLVMMGADAGVGFRSKYVPEDGLIITVLSNRTEGDIALYAYLKDAFS